MQRTLLGVLGFLMVVGNVSAEEIKAFCIPAATKAEIKKAITAGIKAGLTKEGHRSVKVKITSMTRSIADDRLVDEEFKKTSPFDVSFSRADDGGYLVEAEALQCDAEILVKGQITSKDADKKVITKDLRSNGGGDGMKLSVTGILRTKPKW